MTRVLITGGSGMIGSNLAHFARGRGDEVVFTYRTNPASIGGCRGAMLDITDADACRALVDAERPDIVINNAASIAVAQLEADWSFAHATNVQSTANVAAAAKRVGARLVHVSSDWVFRGDLPPGSGYREEDERDPINNYGRSKALAEDAVVQAGLLWWLITRPADVYGVNLARPPEGDLRTHVLERSCLAVALAARLVRGEPLTVPRSVYQCPTSVRSYVEQVFALVDGGHDGVFHTAGDAALNRMELATLIAEVFGADPNLVHEGTVVDLLRLFGFPEGQPPMEAPANAALDVVKAAAAVGPQIGAREGLEALRDELVEMVGPL